MTVSEFGAHLRENRERLGLSHARVADLVGRAPSTLKAWERGQQIPTDPTVLSSLAAVLGIDERRIFSLAGLEPPGVADPSPTIEQSLRQIAPGAGDRSPIVSRVPPRDAPPTPVVPVVAPSVVSPPVVPSRRDLRPVKSPLIYRVRAHLDSVRAAITRSVATVRTSGAFAPPVGGGSISYVELKEQREFYRRRAVYTTIAMVVVAMLFVWGLNRFQAAFSEAFRAILPGEGTTVPK